MKKKIITAIVVIVLLILAFTQLDFAKPGNGGDNVVVGEKTEKKEAIKVKLTVDDSVLLEDKNKSQLSEELQKQLSKDGKKLDNLTIEVYGEQNVADIVKAVGQAKGIAFEFVKSSGMEYLNGINGINGGVLGANSGWIYRINGKIAAVGMPETIVKDGDDINLKFSLDGMAEYAAENK